MVMQEFLVSVQSASLDVCVSTPTGHHAPEAAEADLGRLTTHVLDTAAGVPAAGMIVRLLKADTREIVREVRTNTDGRCESPLLEGEALARGRYVLLFSVADYFRARRADLADPPFLDVVEIAFGVGDADANYHVPLLVSPWAYSTYRGS
jgi:5-hydroxyisourate hydrolase